MIELKNILNRLRDDVLSEKIDVYDAAVELYDAGWINWIDTERTKRLLNIMNYKGE